MATVIRQILRNDTEHRWVEITLMSNPARRFQPSGGPDDRSPIIPLQVQSHRESLKDHPVPSGNETVQPNRRKP